VSQKRHTETVRAAGDDDMQQPSRSDPTVASGTADSRQEHAHAAVENAAVRLLKRTMGRYRPPRCYARRMDQDDSSASGKDATVEDSTSETQALPTLSRLPDSYASGMKQIAEIEDLIRRVPKSAPIDPY
jgi:hypothetical protein